MMMIKQLLEHADLAIFAEISLALFLAVFIVVVIRAIRHTRQEVDAMANLPLAGDEAPPAAETHLRQ
jgi:hypothetical protein